jgi:Ion channel
MGVSDPTNFSQSLDRVSAIYFTVTVLSTVGVGDITAESDASKVLVTIEFATLCGAGEKRSGQSGASNEHPAWQLRRQAGALPPTCPRCSVQAHAQHQHGGGYAAHVIVTAHRRGEVRQHLCQLDVPTPQRAQTLEAFQRVCDVVWWFARGGQDVGPPTHISPAAPELSARPRRSVQAHPQHQHGSCNIPHVIVPARRRG